MPHETVADAKDLEGAVAAAQPPSGPPAVMVDAPLPAAGLVSTPTFEGPPPLPAMDSVLIAPPPVVLPPAVEPPGDPVAAPPPAKFRVKPSAALVKSFDQTAKIHPRMTKAARRRSPVLVFLLLAVLLGGGGYYGYYGYVTYIAPKSEANSAVLDEDAGLSGQMAGDGVANESDRADDPGNDVQTATPTSVMATMPARAEAPLPPPEPSAAFRRLAENMRVSGVYQGEPPRALIDGRTIRAGDPVDIGLGVIFVGIDAERRLILMREGSGATLAKKY